MHLASSDCCVAGCGWGSPNLHDPANQYQQVTGRQGTKQKADDPIEPRKAILGINHVNILKAQLDSELCSRTSKRLGRREICALAGLRIHQEVGINDVGFLPKMLEAVGVETAQDVFS